MPADFQQVQAEREALLGSRCGLSFRDRSELAIDFAGCGATLMFAGKRRQPFPTTCDGTHGNVVALALRRLRCPTPNASIGAARR
jgi:hypothetical protein